MTRLMDAFKEANLNPSDDLFQGLEKIANVEKCRQVLLPILYPDTKLLLEANCKLMAMTKNVKAHSLDSEKKSKETLALLQQQILTIQASSKALLESAKEESAKYQSLQTQLLDLNKQNEDQTKELTKLKNMFNEYEQQHKGSQQEIEKLKEELKSSDAKAALTGGDYSEQITKRDATITALTAQLEQQVDANMLMNDKVTLLAERNELHQSQQLASSETNAKYAAFVIKSRNIIQSLNENLHVQLSESANLKQKMEELKAERDSLIQKSEPEINALREEKNVLDVHLNQLQAEHAEYRAQSQSKILQLEQELKDTSDELSVLEEQLSVSNKKSQKAIAHLSKAKSMIYFATKQNHDLLSSAQSAKKEIMESTFKLRERDQRLVVLKGELEKMVAANQKLGTDFGSARDQISLLSTENEKLIGSLNHSRDMIQKSAVTLTTLNETQTRLASLVEAAKASEQRNQTEISNLKCDLEKKLSELHTETNSKRKAIALLTKTSILLGTMKKAQELSLKELHKREDLYNCMSAQYKYSQDINQQLLSHLKSAKHIIMTKNDDTVNHAREREYLNLVAEQKQSQLSLANGKLKSAVDRLQSLSNDCMAIKAQRKEATMMIAKMVSAFESNAENFKKAKLNAQLSMTNLVTTNKSLQADKNVMAKRLVDCLNLLAATKAEYEQFAGNQLSMQHQRRQESIESMKKYSYLRGQLATVKDAHQEMAKMYDDLQTAHQRIMFLAGKSRLENEQLKHLIVRFKDATRTQSFEVMQKDREWEKVVAKKSRDQLLLIQSAKEKIVDLQTSHRSHIASLNEHWRQELNSVVASHEDKVKQYHLEYALVAKKLAKSVDLMKRFRGSTRTTLDNVTASNKRLRSSLNESNMKTITLRDFAQHRLADLHEQLSNLSILCSEQQASKEHIITYCAEAVRYDERLQDVLVSYKQRLASYKEICRVQTDQNVGLKRQLLDAQCRSTEPYIDELERRVTLMQGQLAEANAHSVQMMELLQIKLSQDLHGRVTKQQAEREVLLLREMATK